VALRGAVPRECVDLDSLRFEPLPGATSEGATVAELWRHPRPPPAPQVTPRVTTLSGAGATEAAFKALAPGHRVLHLATHGFFLSGRCAGVDAGVGAAPQARGIGSVSRPGESPLFPTAGAAIQNPMLLSGLVLAGANNRAARSRGEDGILTAEEIASLPLHGAEWAVLSACDTGVGEIRAGEGVLGLRWALRVAGVRTVIMSLWPVADDATQAWMTALYAARLDDALDTAGSVHRASLRVLAERRRERDSTHPFHWAGFVAAGDWH
jgi:CHAT domain-containing protein